MHWNRKKAKAAAAVAAGIASPELLQRKKTAHIGKEGEGKKVSGQVDASGEVSEWRQAASKQKSSDRGIRSRS